MKPTLLLQQDKIPLRPLAEWANDLRAALRARQVVADWDLQDRTVVSECGNNAALIAVHHGRADAAWELCSKQCAWHVNDGARTNDVEIMRLAMQPWINLGRLEAIRGDWASACDRYRTLHQHFCRDRIVLGDATISCRPWKSRDDSAQRWVDAVFVVDSLKACLMNRQFSRILEFTGPIEGDLSSSLKLFALEANALAHDQLGDGRAARRAIDEGLERSKGWNNIVFRIRDSELTRSSSRSGENYSRLAVAAEIAAGVSPECMKDSAQASIIHRLASLCGELGLVREASLTARTLHGIATFLDDEVLTIESLKLLAEYGAPAERGEQADRLAEVLVRTLYRRYRAGRAVADSPILDALYAQFQAMIGSGRGGVRMQPNSSLDQPVIASA